MQIKFNYIFIVILILIIIFCILYFYWNINKEKNTLENFNSNTSSLSTYYINSTKNRSIVNNIIPNKNNIHDVSNDWDGFWINKSKNRYIYANFKRLNNKLLIALTYTYKNMYNNNLNKNCGSNNIMILSASLNFKNNIFYRTDSIFCNSFVNNYIIPFYTIDKTELYGKIVDNNEIYIYNYLTQGNKYIKFKRYNTIENFDTNDMTNTMDAKDAKDISDINIYSKKYWYPDFLEKNRLNVNDMYKYYDYLIDKFTNKDNINFKIFKDNFKNYLSIKNNGQFELSSNGICPPNYQNMNGNCISLNPPYPCNGEWTDPNLSSNGRTYKCNEITGNYNEIDGGYCPSDFQNVNGICIPPNSPNSPNSNMKKEININIKNTKDQNFIYQSFINISKNILNDESPIQDVILYYTIGQLPLDFKITNIGWSENILYKYSKKYNTVNKFLSHKNMINFIKHEKLKEELPIHSLPLETEKDLSRIIHYYLRPTIALPWKAEYLNKYNWSERDLDKYKDYLINNLKIKNPLYSDFSDFSNIYKFVNPEINNKSNLELNNTNITELTQTSPPDKGNLTDSIESSSSIESFQNINNNKGNSSALNFKFPLPNYLTVMETRDIDNIDKIIRFFSKDDSDITVNFNFWYPNLLRDYGWTVKHLYEYRNFMLNRNMNNNNELKYSDFKLYISDFIQHKKDQNYFLLEDKFFYFDNILSDDLLFRDVIQYYSIGQFPYNFNISKFKWNKELLMKYSKNYNDDVNEFLNIYNMSSFSMDNKLSELPITGFILHNINDIDELINYYLDPEDLPLWNNANLKMYNWTSTDLNDYKDFLNKNDNFFSNGTTDGLLGNKVSGYLNTEIDNKKKTQMNLIEMEISDMHNENQEYYMFKEPNKMGQYIINTWNDSKKYPLPNYKLSMYNNNARTIDEIISFYEESEPNNNLTDYLRKNLEFINHRNVNFCGYMKNFYKYNSCVICYVSDLKNVKTLNYEFFGSFKSESYLTLKKDKYSSYLESSNSLLEYYQKNILNCKDNLIADIDIKNMRNNFSYDKFLEILNNDIFPYLKCLFGELQNINNSENYINNILNALSFTNIIEYKKELGKNNSIEDLINMSAVEAIYLRESNNYNSILENNNTMPMIWKIDGNSNVNDYCNFSLSSSSLENSVIKYPEFNEDGTTNLSLFKGGSKKILSIENQKIIYESENIDTNGDPLYTAITGNLRASNGLYLINGYENSGFEEDITSVKLKSVPFENGKWFIVGFNLENKNSLNKIFNYKLF
jgi:hypothetical protein